MSYLKLLNAQRKSGQQPRIKAMRFSELQKQRAAHGQCIRCGTHKADRHSYICKDCQAEDTIEEIRDDISALRRKILKRSDV